MGSVARAAGAVVVAAVGVWAAPAGAQPAYRLRPEVDVPVLAVGAAVAAGWALSGEFAPAHCAPACDRASVNALDRATAGRYSAGWNVASDVGLAATFALPLAALAVDEGPRDALHDAVVLAEAVVLAQAVAVVSNVGTRRPRPFLYGTDAPLDLRAGGNGGLSFFSGHTAGAFAAVVATFGALHRRHPRGALPWVALGLGLGGAAFVGASRVAAGYHFLTDVLAGALVGTALGVLVPALHASPVRVVPTAHAAGAGVALVGVF